MDVECSNGAVKTAFHIQVEGKHGPGRPKMTWKQLTERDCREWKLLAISPHDRNMWRSGGSKPAIWKGSHLCGCCPSICTLIKNLIMIYDIYEMVVFKIKSRQNGNGIETLHKT